MQFSTVILAGFVALASAQGATYTGPTVTPTAPAPAGCTGTSAGTFELSVANISMAMSKVKVSELDHGNVSRNQSLTFLPFQRQSQDNALLITLKNGILTDSEGRIGYIASNYQFQFDFGGQAGEIYAGGFSMCANNTLALGGSAIFYECLSGNFYNLYDRSWAPQCKPVYLDTIAAKATGSNTFSSGAVPSTSMAASSASSASVSVATSVSVTTSSAAGVTAIGDGQPQAPTTTSKVVASATLMSTSTITPSPTMVTSAAIVSSITDHQIQAPTSVAPYTGAAAMPTVAAQLLLAAAGAAVALL